MFWFIRCPKWDYFFFTSHITDQIYCYSVGSRSDILSEIMDSLVPFDKQIDNGTYIAENFQFFVKLHFFKQIISTVRKSRAIKDRISGFFS